MIEDVIKKFNYDDNLASFLRKLYPYLIEYFKTTNKDLVDMALMSCPIVLGCNSFDLLKKLDMLDNDGLVQDDDLKRSSGVYSSKPVLNYIDGEFVVSDVKRVVGISFDDINSEYAQDTLIHELCHLIKSSYQEYLIDKDTLIQKNGLIERHYQLTYENGMVKKSFIKEMGVGLEEGLNTLAEEWLAKQVIRPDFKISGYQTIAQLAQNVLVNQQVVDEMLNAQLYKKRASLNGYYDEFVQIIDIIYKKYLEMFASIFDQEKFDKLNEELRNLIISQYHPLVDKILSAKKEL